MKILPLSLLLCIVSTAVSNAQVDVEQRFGLLQEVRELPLVVNAADVKGRGLWLTSLRSVIIESVRCDGEVLPHAFYNARINEINVAAFTMSSIHVVYMVPASGRLVYIREIDKHGNAAAAAAYMIPNIWQTLELEYRIRFADGSKSRIHRARFARLSVTEMEKAQQEHAKMLGRLEQN